MTITHVHRVRYHEVDPQGFLFNSRFLEIADVAMAEFFRQLGWNYAELNAAGADPSVVNATITFFTPARFDDELAIDVRCSRVGTSSFTLEVEYLRAGKPCAHAAMTYVNIAADAAISVPLPPQIAAALRDTQSPADSRHASGS